MILTNDLYIVCSDCGNRIVISKNEIEPETLSYEREMGAEIQHDFNGIYNCERCTNEISFIISGYEYPVGAFNYQNCKVNGGRFFINPEITINNYISFDDDVISYNLPGVELNLMRILQNKDYVYKLSPREFEEVVENVFKQQGFKTELTSQTRDGGKDIIACKVLAGKPFIVYIECKKFGNEKRVGVNVVRAAYGVQMNDKVNKSIIVTSSYFTDGAIKFAAQQNTFIDLINIDELLKLMQDCLD